MDAWLSCKTWLEDAGVSVDALTMSSCDTPEERGLQVTRAVAAGERLLSLPQSSTINTLDVARTPLGRALSGLEVDRGPTMLVAYLLQQVRDDNSPWLPYLASLPPSFSHLPNTQLHLLTPVMIGMWAMHFILSDAGRMMSAYKAVHELAPQYATDLQGFAWASMAVRTRMFAGEVGGEKVLTLPPVIDLLNHAFDPDLRWSVRPTGGMEIHAVRPVAPGREIFHSYGDRSNSVLFARYGFILDGNPLREAMVVVRPVAPITGVRAALLQGPGPYAFTVQPNIDAAPTRKLISCLRILNASDAQLAILAEEKVASDAVPQLGEGNRSRVRASIVSLAQAARHDMQAQRPRCDTLPEHIARPVRTLFDEELSVLGWLESNAEHF